MVVLFITEVNGVPHVETLGDDDVQQLQLLINGGAKVIRIEAEAVCFDKEISEQSMLDHLTSLYGSGKIEGSNYITQSP